MINLDEAQFWPTLCGSFRMDGDAPKLLLLIPSLPVFNT
jgi:hypothetical protein